jgi:protein-tyrosine phosphatase
VTKVLFVCLGNICRSPAAEGVFRALALRAGLDGGVLHIDSAGTGAWHEGEPPDARMIEHAHRRGYDLTALRARRIRAPHDLNLHDHILTMDNSNLTTVRALDPEGRYHHKIKSLASYCLIHHATEVPDPYHRAADGFEHVLDLLEDACEQLLQQIKGELA